MILIWNLPKNFKYNIDASGLVFMWLGLFWAFGMHFYINFWYMIINQIYYFLNNGHLDLSFLGIYKPFYIYFLDIINVVSKDMVDYYINNIDLFRFFSLKKLSIFKFINDG